MSVVVQLESKDLISLNAFINLIVADRVRDILYQAVFHSLRLELFMYLTIYPVLLKYTTLVRSLTKLTQSICSM